MRKAGLLLLLLLLPATAAPHRDWDPAHTWCFLVGVLEWKDSEMWGSFPTKDRRDVKLVNLLKQQGVPSSHIVYLQDRQATKARIDQSLRQLIGQMPPQDTLFLYYAGHGYRSDNGGFFMAPYDSEDDDSSWGIASVIKTIDGHLRGRAFLAADCCYSGSISRLVVKGQHPVSYGVWTSSTAKFESTGNWTFSDALLEGLSGSPLVDANHDGVVTFAEIGNFIQKDMRFVDEQDADSVATGNLGTNTAMAVTSRALRPGEGERVQVLYEGDYWKGRVVDQGSQGVKIHWLGEDGYPDEWVDPATVKR